MAMKKRQVTKAPAQNDNTVTKAAYGLGIFAILFLVVSRLVPYYRLNGYMFDIRDTLQVLQYVLAAVGVVFLGLWFALRKKRPNLNHLLLAAAALFLLAGASANFLYTTWVSYVTLLYVGYVIVLVAFLVYLLYPLEFFLITISVVMSGLAFYTMRSDAATWMTLGCVFFFLLLCGALAFLAGRNQGKVGKFTLFPTTFNPTNLYINSALWLVCLVMALILGPVFAYYCLFAVGAVWLVFAVYYTVKLS